jgi:hypothetical protein
MSPDGTVDSIVESLRHLQMFTGLRETFQYNNSALCTRYKPT